MKKSLEILVIILISIIFTILFNNPITQIYMVSIMILALISTLSWFMY